MPVPIPIVVVSVPEVSTPLEQHALIESCDDAFETGECLMFEGSAEAGSLTAQITWMTETQARIVLEVPATALESGGGTASEQQFTFQEADAPQERYRALGFAIGSLANSVFESREPAPEPPQPEPGPAPPAAGPEATPAVQVQRPPSQETRGRGPRPTPAWHRDASAAVNAALLLGSGFQTARFGGLLGGYVTVVPPWTGSVALGYALQSPVEVRVKSDELSQRVSAEFATLRLGVGPRWQLNKIETALSAVAALHYARFTNQRTGISNSGPVSVVGGLAGELRWITTNVEPFIVLQATWGRATDVEFDREPGASEGPLRAEAQVGISLPFGRPPALARRSAEGSGLGR